MSKAVLLFSGGLDSILAFKVLENAGVTPHALFFETPFFTREKPEYYANKNNIKLNVHDIFTKHRAILLEPKMGYGKNLNPCIDCHALMINSAIELMHEYDADFTATGEVLGQRPKSQNRHAFGVMEHMITHPEKLLRPLSAGLMKETEMEKNGLVERSALCSFKGRGRGGQLKLAEELGIKEFPGPSGGCLLTQSQFTHKLKILIDRKLFTKRNAELIKLGRIFEMDSSIGIIGRDEQSNIAIESLCSDMKKYQIENGKGPVGILIGTVNKEEEKKFKEHLLTYSKNAENYNIITVD